MENNSFLKVIYFDESFVADFMQIIAGGELKKTTEFISEVNSEMGAEAGVDVILSILVYTFFSRMFDLMLPPVAKHSIVVA